MQSVVDPTADPSALRTFLNRLAIHRRRESHNLKKREYILRKQFPRLSRIDWRRKWSAGKDCICFRQAVATHMPDDLFISISQKEFGGSVRIEWILFLVHQLSSVHQEGRDPGGVAFIDFPLESYEPPPITAGGYPPDDDGIHLSKSARNG